MADEPRFDRIFDGRLALCQRPKGYRISLDPIFLGHFAAISLERGAVQSDGSADGVSPKRVLDLGTGSGAVAFTVLALCPETKALGIEIQPGLANAAALGAKENGFRNRFCVVQADLNHFQTKRRFDLVTFNPRFTPPDLVAFQGMTSGPAPTTS